MKAEVKRLHSPDALDLRRYEPEQPDDFSILIQILVGPVGSEGEESFDVEVVTPKRLATRASQKGPISGRHLLIVNTFDYDTIAKWIHRVVASCEGVTWTAVADRLGRIGRWEFEDYTD
jgi:hypothetical protein